MMGEHTKGRARVAETVTGGPSGAKTYVDDDYGGWGRAVIFGPTEDAARERAERYVAGWNLLETLEEMDGVEVLTVAADLLTAHGSKRGQQIRSLAAAIRTALSSSTPDRREA
jgi:hypothetical protein